jgi:uncharacterized protein with FMN-binding domain
VSFQGQVAGETAMARKLNKNLVALGSAAIATVYAVGFMRTAAAGVTVRQHAPAEAASARSAPVANTTAAVAIATRLAATGSSPSPDARDAATALAPVLPIYADGTYTGTGGGRLGAIQVRVTIRAGQVAVVNITRSTTHYSAARISRLAGQVVDHQSADVDLVSGATYSSRAFCDAVKEALAQAASGGQS